MTRRCFDDPDTVEVIDHHTREMLHIRGGADRLLFADRRPELNGRTLQQVADELDMEPSAAARHILRQGNATVINLDLYDVENVRHLAQLDWMMTCTDGRDPGPTRPITHPRAFGSFSKKIRDLVLEEGLITLPHAVRSMTGLAADFLEWPERGYLREGYFADIAAFELEAVRDVATYEDPHQYSEGTMHVLVNGTLAIRDGQATLALAGRALVRGGAPFEEDRSRGQ